jgi:hypothetical protein
MHFLFFFCSFFVGKGIPETVAAVTTVQSPLNKETHLAFFTQVFVLYNSTMLHMYAQIFIYSLQSTKIEQCFGARV